jgi:hypothetical protein
MTQQQAVNWDRITEMEPLFVRVARHWSARTGEDPDDIASMMRLHVIERAAEVPTFLSQKPSYILTFAGWRALDKVRAQWQDGETVSLDERTEIIGDHVVSVESADIREALSGENRVLASAIIEAGDEVLKRNGTLNISALARHLGRPERTVNRQVGRLRQAMRVVGQTAL